LAAAAPDEPAVVLRGQMTLVLPAGKFMVAGDRADNYSTPRSRLLPPPGDPINRTVAQALGLYGSAG